jgi:hypothetical protein
MKNLGKILYIIMIVHSALMASVKGMLEVNPILEGDVAVFVIEAEGKEIVFPKIQEISGVKVEKKTTTRSLLSVNKKMKKSLTRKYYFTPKHAMTIPSYEVIVDGKKEQTDVLKLQINKDEKDGKKAFIFQQKVDKAEVFVGEPILLTYTFKQRLDIDLSEANFNAPSFHDFWAKTTRKVPNKVEDGYNIYTIHYLLYPQKSGRVKIESGRMDIGVLSTRKRDFFSFKQAKWKTLYTNPLEVEVKPLPKGVSLYGDYSFTVVADKNQTKANEPVNLTITITGEGNVDDIEDFSIEVPHATVYADKAKRSANLTNGQNSILFKQKFAIVSDRNFTIPSLSFTFFHDKIEQKHSREFPIEVINTKKVLPQATLQKAKEEQETVIKERVVYQKSDIATIMISSILSFLAGMMLMWFYIGRNRSKKIEKDSLEVRVKRSKGDKELLALLLPYLNATPKMQALIKKLEENVYEGASHSIDRKKIAKVLESYLKEEKEEEILKG